MAVPWWLAIQRGASVRHPLSRCPDLQVVLIPDNKKTPATADGARREAQFIPARALSRSSRRSVAVRLPSQPGSPSSVAARFDCREQATRRVGCGQERVVAAPCPP